MDIQTVRSERRRLHNEIGAQSNRVGHSRADGKETASTDISIRVYDKLMAPRQKGPSET